MTKTISKKQKPIPIKPIQKTDAQNGKIGLWMEILLLYGGILGYIFCNTTALDMKIPALVVVLITALSFGLMILLAWYKRVFFGVLGGATALSLAAFPITFPLFKNLGYSLNVWYNYTIYLLGTQEGFGNYLKRMTLDLTDILEKPQLLTRHFYAVVILLSLVISAFFALGLYRRIPILISFTAAMVGLIPYFVYGIVPHYAAFSLFLSTLIGCYGQNVVQWIQSRHQRDLKKKASLDKTKIKKKKKTLTTQQRWAFAAGHGSFGVIVAVIMLGVTMSTAAVIYSRPIVQMDKVRAALDYVATEVTNTLFRSQYERELNVAGYMAPKETLSLSCPAWRHLKVLGVGSTTDTPIYIRYRTTVNLEKDGWSIPDQEYLERLNAAVSQNFCENTQFYNYLRLTAPTGDPLKAGLDHIDSPGEGYMNDRVTIVPYYKVSTLLGLPQGAVNKMPIAEYVDLERFGDTLLRHYDKPADRSYMFQVTIPNWSDNQYLTNFQTTQNQYLQMRRSHARENEYLREEAKYAAFVQENYVALPTELRDAVRSHALELTDPYQGRLQKMQALERYLRSNYTYSLRKLNLRTEEGNVANAAETIQYFLYQNKDKDGYCTLFASSMVAMARSIGVPARVVSGYYADPLMNDLNNYGVVLYDNNYHAWVEVYFDGIGWVAFEPTPDYGAPRNYYLLEMADQGKQDEVDANVNVKVEYVEDPDYIKYTNDLPDPVEKEELELLPDAITGTPAQKSWKGWIKIVLWILLAIILLAGFIAATVMIHQNTIKKLTVLDPSAAVRRGYELILRLMQLMGFCFFEGELLEDFARRADNLRFTKLKLTPVVPVLQKALYSELQLSEEERAMVVAYVKELDHVAFWEANPVKALWYRWTLWVKPRYKKMIWRFE